jgi:hypothetical protein
LDVASPPVKGEKPNVKFLHLHRKGFIIFNGLFILAISASQLVDPERFWRFFGVISHEPNLVRVSGWYLFTFGLAALLIRKKPEDHPVVVGILGLEKLGAVTLLAPELLKIRSNVALILLGVVDATLSVLLLGYAWWLWREFRR